MHQIEPESDLIATDDDSLYSYVNSNIKYGLFEDIVDSYYLDSQIKLKMISNATMTVTHNIGTRQMTATLMHAHMTIIK